MYEKHGTVSEGNMRSRIFAALVAMGLFASGAAVAQQQYATQLSSDPKVNFGICTGKSLDGSRARGTSYDMAGNRLKIAACTSALALSNLTEWGRADVYASRSQAQYSIASELNGSLPEHPDRSYTLDDAAAQAIMNQRASIRAEMQALTTRAKADSERGFGLVLGKGSAMFPNDVQQKLSDLYLRGSYGDGPDLPPLRPYAERRLPNAQMACEMRVYENNASEVRDVCGLLIAEPVAGEALRKAYGQRARARQTLKDLPGARSDVDQALRMNADDLELLSLSADLYLAASERERALKDLQRIVALDPDQKVISTGRRIANLYYPSCLNAAATPGAAAMPEPCRLALATLKDNGLRVSLLVGLGATKLRVGANADAEAAFDQAVNITPDRATFALYARGIARERLGRKADAEADMALAVTRDPQIAERLAQSQFKITR
jgi:tetratricopeptide (TPR) repeat protein